MSKPTTPFIKLAALYAWLVEGHGFKPHAVKDLVKAETIPRHIFPGRKYGYYHVPAVAAALSIPDPLSTTTNPKPCSPPINPPLPTSPTNPSSSNSARS